jgi:hypothetical protein
MGACSHAPHETEKWAEKKRFQILDTRMCQGLSRPFFKGCDSPILCCEFMQLKLLNTRGEDFVPSLMRSLRTYLSTGAHCRAD